MHTLHHTMHTLAQDYNFRLPRDLKRMLFIGIFCLIAAGAALYLLPQSIVVWLLLGIGLLHILPGVLVWLIIRSLNGIRLRLRDQMVNRIQWRGDEQVLDVGTGNGISLIGCARRLTTGKAIGIDIWNPNAGGGTPDVFWKNVRLSGIADRVELHNADARQMPFADASFDVIVSSFAMHHVGGAEARTQAAREMVRVLKPGGIITIIDVSGVLDSVAEVLQENGFREVRKTGHIFSTLTGYKE